jgi:hypothetical protein
MKSRRKKRSPRELDETRKPPANPPAEPQRRENPDERRPEEWDPGGAP